MISIAELLHKEGIKASEHEEKTLNSQVKELHEKLRNTNDKLNIIESCFEGITYNLV